MPRGAIEALAPASCAGRADPGARPAAGHPGDPGAVRRRAPRARPGAAAARRRDQDRGAARARAGAAPGLVGRGQRVHWRWGCVLIGAQRVRQANRQLAQSNALLQHQAEIDPLTGLANRRHLQEAMRRLGADGSFAGTVFLADLDHFKRINDCHGHAAGDAVLVEMAQRLRSVAARRRPDRALGRRGVPGDRARARCRRGAGAGAAHAGRRRRHAVPA